MCVVAMRHKYSFAGGEVCFRIPSRDIAFWIALAVVDWLVGCRRDGSVLDCQECGQIVMNLSAK